MVIKLLIELTKLIKKKYLMKSSNQNKNRWIVLLNPHAGGKNAGKLWPSIKNELTKQKFHFELQETKKPFEAINIIKCKIEEGYRNIIAIGGDGTLHEVINGIMAQKVADTTKITLGLISIGTGNDWIKTHQISDDYKIAIKQIKEGKTMLQDVGQILFKDSNQQEDKRFFINSVGIGFDAKVVKTMLPKKEKGIANKNGYINGLIKSLFTNKNVKGWLHFDNQQIETKIYNLSIGICKYKGGGFKLLPNAIPDDGILDITLASSISKFKLLKSLPKIFKGKVDQIKYFDFYTAQKILLDLTHPIGTEVDGEFLSYHPMEISVIPQQIRLISAYKDI